MGQCAMTPSGGVWWRIGATVCRGGAAVRDHARFRRDTPGLSGVSRCGSIMFLRICMSYGGHADKEEAPANRHMAAVQALLGNDTEEPSER